MSLSQPIALSPPNSIRNVLKITSTVLPFIAIYEILPIGNSRYVINGTFTNINSKARDNVAIIDSLTNVESGFRVNALTGYITDVLEVDSNFIIVGDFSVVNGITRNYIAQLNPSGSVHARTFPAINNITTGIVTSSFNSYVYVYGLFTTPKNKIVALDISSPTTVTTVSAFTPANSTGDIAGVIDHLTETNKLLVFGVDLVLSTKKGIYRISSTTGTLDDGFTTPLTVGSDVYSVHVNSGNGALTIAGAFTAGNVLSDPGAVVYPLSNLIRTFANGSIYPYESFYYDPATTDISYIRAMCVIPYVAPGDKMDHILIGGAAGNMYLLNPFGAVDTSFGTSGKLTISGGAIYTIKYISNNEILVGGDFTHVGGVARSGFAVIDVAGNLL